MDPRSFKELLEAKKLLSVQGDPLHLYSHICEDANKGDSFFETMSLALYGNAQKRVHLRAACLLRFIRIFFYKTRSITSVQSFLDDHAAEARVSRKAYRDEAIQVWLRRHTHHQQVSPKALFRSHGDSLKDDALLFVRQNNQVGMLTCRFTFCYLMAALYPITVHLYDQLHDANGPVHIQPAIRVEPKGMEEPAEDTHIYIWYNSHNFKLLVPCTPVRSRGTLLRETQMKRRPYLYELRKSLEEQRNLSVCTLKPLPQDETIHVCTLTRAQLEQDRNAIFMLFPANGRFELHIPKGEHLFVYCVREADTDVRPRIECLVELGHDIVHPYFLLPLDTRHVIVTVSSLMRDDVLTKLAPFFL